MAYDEKKDIQLWEGRIDNLILSVQKYNSGVAKFQVGPRIMKNAKGEESFAKAGRLTLEEMDYINKSMPAIKKAMAA